MSDWILRTLEQTGYWGVAALMFAENLFPPIPSEVVMPFAGFQASRGRHELALVVLAGTAGSMAGAVFWYGLARWLGRNRLKAWAGKHGRWIAISPSDIDQAIAWFDRHCGKAVFFGRLVPGVRTLISVPAGFSSMSLRKFLPYTFLGTAIWSSLLGAAGYVLEDRFTEVGTYLDPISLIVVGSLVAWYLFRVVTFESRRFSS